MVECWLTKRRLVAGGTACWLVFFVVLALFIICGFAYRRHASEFFLQRLTWVRHLPESGSAGTDVVYVLGGNDQSLKMKFRTASKLVREGRAARILVLSQPSLMAFSPALELNLTFDEWVIATLGGFGVRSSAIELVAFEEGYFGTWSEAKGISRLVSERGYRRLILVTSPFHSRRVWESFSRTVERADTHLFLYLSNETVPLRFLLLEYAKLLLYRAQLF